MRGFAGQISNNGILIDAAILPALFARADSVSLITTIVTLLALTLLGSLAAYAGGASVLRGAIRVTFWGALAMGVTAMVGNAIGAAI